MSADAIASAPAIKGGQEETEVSPVFLGLRQRSSSVPVDLCVRLVRQWLLRIHISDGEFDVRRQPQCLMLRQNPQGDHAVHVYGPDEGEEGPGHWSDAPSVNLFELLDKVEPK